MTHFENVFTKVVNALDDPSSPKSISDNETTDFVHDMNTIKKKN